MTSKRVIQAALALVKSTQDTYPYSKTRKELAELGYGQMVGRKYVISRSDRNALKGLLEGEGVDWRLDPNAYGAGHREDTAAQGIHEKHARRTTHGKRVLIQALAPGVRVNGQPLPLLSLTGACLSVDKEAITSLQAGALVVVENSRAFHRMRDQALAVVPERWLAIYRGDPQHASGQAWAQEQAQRHRLRLYAYTDFDPAGLMIAIAMGAERVLVPNLNSLAELPGSEPDFDRQQAQWAQLRTSVAPDSALAPWVSYLARRKAGFTQERLLSTSIPLEVVLMERAQ